MEIYSCKIDHLTDPMGWELPSLCASWKVRGSAGTKQTAARIEVRYNDEIIWDSGMAELDSLATPIPIVLLPRTQYLWQVTVQDNAGDTAHSGINRFETGKMNEPWHGKWIGCTQKHTPIFRKRFDVESMPASARLYGVGLGLYEARINGQKVGDEYLLPGCTLYSARVQTQTFDIAPYLQLSENMLEVRLADGWYMGRFGLDDQPCHYGDHYALLMELHLDDRIIATDESWETAQSDVVALSLYDGETWEPASPMKWEAAILLPYEQHTLIGRVGTATRVHKRLPVKEVLHTPSGACVLDFGQNMSGFVTFFCDLPQGSAVRLSYGEWMEAGELYRKNLGSAKQEFTYVSDGIARMVAPHFSCFGFRYVQVNGMDQLNAENFTACALWSDMDETGNVDLHNDLLNRFIENVKWGQRSNYVDIPTDCPQRAERLGWTADAQVFADTAAYQTDVSAFLDKFCGDMALEQACRNGAVPHVVPAFGEEGSCAVWGDAGTIIPWTLYEHYGDKALLRRHYPGMRAWVDYVRAIDEEQGNHRLWLSGFQFGDWLALDSENGDKYKGATEDAYIASAYYYHSVQLTSKAASVLGYIREEAELTALANEILAAIHAEYFTQNGRLAITTQTGYALALDLGLCPKGTERRTAEALVDKLKNTKYHLNTGFVGTPCLCRVLSRNGFHEIACRLLLNEDYPSWLYEVKLGATTVWERWDSITPDGHFNEINMNSLNHYSYGSVVSWIYTDLAGLHPMDSGMRKVMIAPKPFWRIPQLDMAFDSPMGEYYIGYRLEADDSVNITIHVPFGAEASLLLPSHDGQLQQLQSGKFEFRYQPRIRFRPSYHIRLPLAELEESEECMQILKSNGIDSNRVPLPMHEMTLEMLSHTPFVHLDSSQLESLDAQLRAV